MLDDMKVLFTLVVVLTTAFFTLVVLPLNYYHQWQCENYQEITGRESKWVHFDNCYVKTKDDEWIRYDDKFKE